MAFQFQAWADAPSTGAYPEHELSSVFSQAVAQTNFVPLAKRVPIQSGSSVTVPITSSLPLPTSSELNEDSSIPLQRISITANTIELVERGSGLMMSRKALSRSPIDLLNIHRQKISEQMSLEIDKVVATAFQSGQIKYAATGAAAQTVTTNGSFGAAALSNANFYHLRKMRDLAKLTYLMPPLPGGTYKFVVSTAGIRGILDDPEFLEINSPQNSSIFKSNMVGRIADVEIIESNNTNNLSDGVGTNSDVGEGVFIADEAVYYAVLDVPQIHFDQSHDHGRFVSIAWYGDFGAEPSTASGSAGYARLIHFGSS